MAYDFNNPTMIEQMRDPDSGANLGYASGSMPSFGDFLVNGKIDWNRVEQFSRAQGWLGQPGQYQFDAKNKARAINNIIGNDQGPSGVTLPDGRPMTNADLRANPSLWQQYDAPPEVINAQVGILSDQASNASHSGTFDRYLLPAMLAVFGGAAAGAASGAGAETAGAYGGAGDFAAATSGGAGAAGGVATGSLADLVGTGAGESFGLTGLETGGTVGASAGPMTLEQILGGAAGTANTAAGEAALLPGAGGAALLPEVAAGVAPEVGALYSGLDQAALGGIDIAAAGTPALPTIAQDWSLPSTPTGSSMGFDAASVAAPAAAAAGSGVLPAAGVGAGTAAAITGATAAAPSLYDRITGGNATNADYLELLGRAAPAALGAVASNQQANSLENIANKYAEYGAPSRARYEASFDPGFTMASDPGYSDAMNNTAMTGWRGGSPGGNPAGNPAVLAEIMKNLYASTAYPALQNYRSGNAAAGGIASGTAAAPGLGTQAINADTNVYREIAGGAADIFNPRKSLTEQIAEILRMQGGRNAIA